MGTKSLENSAGGVVDVVVDDKQAIVSTLRVTPFLTLNSYRTRGGDMLF